MILTKHFIERKEERNIEIPPITKLVTTIPADRKEWKKRNQGKSYISVDIFEDGTRIVRKSNIFITIFKK
jgi:hypothetical protein